ncbi:FMN-binding protein [Demequina sp.]|uniref:FMN-binding protein n=1 Tax=Demequina sp. TaxID=2050685 RepID=UPI0025FD5975|nr:FMN-binding protein [Demequina sp.]
MRASRGVVVAAGCVGIVGAGWAVAPKELPALDLVPPAQPTPVATGTAATFDGPVVTNLRGGYQARITVADGAVTDVQAVVAGTQDPQSITVNAFAIPELRARVLDAQSWDVDAVSGASFTSPAFIESLRGAFDAAGL